VVPILERQAGNAYLEWMYQFCGESNKYVREKVPDPKSPCWALSMMQQHKILVAVAAALSFGRQTSSCGNTVKESKLEWTTLTIGRLNGDNPYFNKFVLERGKQV
jgi:hypothetical protein